MVDSLTLYNAQFHKVKLTETDGAVHIETAILYESKDDIDTIIDYMHTDNNCDKVP